MAGYILLGILMGGVSATISMLMGSMLTEFEEKAKKKKEEKKTLEQRVSILEKQVKNCERATLMEYVPSHKLLKLDELENQLIEISEQIERLGKEVFDNDKR